MNPKRDLKGIKVAVLGMGRTGECCARFLLQRGAEVSVSDSAEEAGHRQAAEELAREGVEFYTGARCLLPLESADMVVASPGVPPGSRQIRAAEENKIDVISEVELFSWFCRSPVIAVTGTNGKTTTTVLISKLMNLLGYDTVPAGNIGLPLTGLEPGFYDGSSPVVCEISSFQLEHTFTFRPFISIVLNITPDHMDFHGGFKEYVRAKSVLVANQGGDDYAVLNRDCAASRGLAGQTSARVVWLGAEEPSGDGVWICSGKIRGRLRGKEIVAGAGEAGLINPSNAMAAAACALIYSAEPEALSGALKSFRGLEHRREFVSEISGVSFYNDSKATNAGAFLDGLRAFGRGVTVISGGRDKGIDYSMLRGEAARRVKRMILMGETAEKLRACFKDVVPCVRVQGLHEAVRAALDGASPGDKVVLLPGTSSFDMFKDYEERGRLFKAEVKNLRKEALN